MTSPDTSLDIRTHMGAGSRPLVDYGAWWMAFLNYSHDLMQFTFFPAYRHAAKNDLCNGSRSRIIV